MLMIRNAILALLLFTGIAHATQQQKYLPEDTVIAFDIHDVIARNDIHGMCSAALNCPKKQEIFLRLFQLSFLKKIGLAMWRQTTLQNILPICDRYNPALSDLLLDVSTEQAIKPEVAAILRNLKKAGYTLHIVSNIEQRSLNVLKRKFPDVFNAFDAEYVPHKYNEETGRLIRKPNHEFFNDYLVECVPDGFNVVFVDDRDRNIASAAACGMHALMFINAPELQYALEKLTLIARD